MRVGAVTRGYFALGSRFSRLPVNFPRYLPRDLADRETAGGGGREEKREMVHRGGRIAIVAERQHGGLGFLPPGLRNSVLRKLNRYTVSLG